MQTGQMIASTWPCMTGCEIACAASSLTEGPVKPRQRMRAAHRRRRRPGVQHPCFHDWAIFSGTPRTDCEQSRRISGTRCRVQSGTCWRAWSAAPG
eukprot:8954351-Lingulodinium_polyedra.AAC.1